MPQVAFMKSHVDFTAISMLSVPPDVMLPQTCPPELLVLLPSIAAVIATASASNHGMLGNTSGCRGFVCENLHDQVILISSCQSQSVSQSIDTAKAPRIQSHVHRISFISPRKSGLLTHCLQCTWISENKTILSFF
jgi:hypothetical protein